LNGSSQAVLWGAAGHARVLRELLSHLGFQLAAVFDNSDVPAPFADVPLLLGRDGFLRWRECNPGAFGGLVAIGGAHGRDRLAMQALMQERGIAILTVVHPRAFVATGAVLGHGSQVLANATVAADARLGAACIVNHAASIDHECRLEDGVHVAPGAVLAGCVQVGAYSLIGTGAVVLPRVRIGADAIVGAGAVVTRDVPDGAVVTGSPATVLRHPNKDKGDLP
jgi:sugar O-acyltransferase (sialic acid O-acetyltransferase NeuD family)